MATNLTNDNNCIQSGLRADIMRSSMENKNLLAKKGSIYVGTGKTQTVGGQAIPTTEALPIGSDTDVLRVVNGDLKYGKLIDGNFDSNTVYSNLTKTVQSITIKPSQISGEYSSLALKNENISTEERYTNLVLVGNNASNRDTTVHSNLLGTLHLRQDAANGQLSLSLTRPTHLYRYTIKLQVSGSFQMNSSTSYSYSNAVFYVTGIQMATGLTSTSSFSPSALLNLTGFRSEEYTDFTCYVIGTPSYIDVSGLTSGGEDSAAWIKRLMLTGGLQLELGMADPSGAGWYYSCSILHWVPPVSGVAESKGYWKADVCTINSHQLTEIQQIA